MQVVRQFVGVETSEPGLCTGTQEPVHRAGQVKDDRSGKGGEHTVGNGRSPTKDDGHLSPWHVIEQITKLKKHFVGKGSNGLCILLIPLLIDDQSMLSLDPIPRLGKNRQARQQQGNNEQ
jgi:hypothetical protein